MINRIFNWTAGSFFRTLGRFVFYGLITAIIVFLFSIFNAKAAVTDDMFFVSYNGFVNDGSYIYRKSTAITSNSKVISANSGVSVTFDINFQSDVNLIGQNYFLQVDICTGMPNYSGVTNSYYFTGAFQYNSHPYHKVNELGSCEINGNDAYLTTDIYVFSIANLIANTEEGGYVGSGSVGSAGGNLSPSYATSWQISNVSILDYDLNFLNQLEINNSNQTIINEQEQTNDKLDDMNDFMQDDSPASTDDIDMDSLGTVSGLLPEGPVDSLLNIPFTFLSVLTSSMGGVCVPITGTFVFDSTLSIPCFDSFYDEVPDHLMNFINLIPAGFILIMYFKHLYKKVERAVSLQTTTDDEWGVI